MKFGELIRHNQPDLVVSKRHEEWLKQNSNAQYSERAIEFAAEQMHSRPRNRRGTISASSLDSCVRRQQFQFIGMPEVSPDTRTLSIFHNGTFMHLRWQMAGLTEGWLAEAEVPVGENEYRLSGTMDGLAYEGTVVEFKSINTAGFASVATYGPKKMHMVQVIAYMLTTGREHATIIYEDKNTQDYREILVPLDQNKDLVEEVKRSVRELWQEIDDEHLAEPLSECEERKGYRYNSCPFKNVCLKTRNWEHAAEQAV